MPTRKNWWQARADDVAVGLLTAMFLVFVLQITSRYVFNAPLEWTLEACLTLWLWTVFWGSAFCLRNEDHIRFDMLYVLMGKRVRRVLAGLSALAVLATMAVALPGTWDFVSFLQIKKSPSLRIPLFYVFSIYMVFMVATMAAYGWRLWSIIRSEDALEAGESPA
jgi:TRAP-type C4-dicarboxylate transport system permease small subunit